MGLKDIILEIVFKLDVQFDAFLAAPLAENRVFLQMTKYYFYYAHL